MSFNDEDCAARCRMMRTLVDCDIAAYDKNQIMQSFLQAQKYALQIVLGEIQVSISSVLEQAGKK